MTRWCCYLTVSHGASDLDDGVVTSMTASINGLMAETVTARSREQVARFFDGLELIEPGLVRISRWLPASELQASARRNVGGSRRQALTRHRGRSRRPG